MASNIFFSLHVPFHTVQSAFSEDAKLDRGPLFEAGFPKPRQAIEQSCLNAIDELR